ncbi:MAG: hypothetical protein KAG97_05330, partial [Victivallales bacterium]|nr:hypothetical protein [Victivallales bacterium]
MWGSDINITGGGRFDMRSGEKIDPVQQAMKWLNSQPSTSGIEVARRVLSSSGSDGLQNIYVQRALSGMNRGGDSVADAYKKAYDEANAKNES